MDAENAGKMTLNKKSDSNQNFKILTRVLSAVLLVVCIVIAIYLWRAGAFSSTEAMQAAIQKTGAAGAALFFAIQVVQVVIPIIPGGVSCLAGVVLFGAWKGFWLNYLGISLGSILAFGISRSIGKDLLHRLFSEDLIAKYENWTDNNNRFAKLFAFATFVPFMPDDFLCYLAGTTKIRWGQFIAIILLGKPLSIAVYSLSLQTIYQKILSLF